MFSLDQSLRSLVESWVNSFWLKFPAVFNYPSRNNSFRYPGLEKFFEVGGRKHRKKQEHQPFTDMSLTKSVRSALYLFNWSTMACKVGGSLPNIKKTNCDHYVHSHVHWTADAKKNRDYGAKDEKLDKTDLEFTKVKGNDRLKWTVGNSTNANKYSINVVECNSNFSMLLEKRRLKRQ